MCIRDSINAEYMGKELKHQHILLNARKPVSQSAEIHPIELKVNQLKKNIDEHRRKVARHESKKSQDSNDPDSEKYDTVCEDLNGNSLSVNQNLNSIISSNNNNNMSQSRGSSSSYHSRKLGAFKGKNINSFCIDCLLYTSPSPRDQA
eukprot:TRINITY_DN8789_c0_g3_i1.p1 TRINITY_DN8789_c0_g3~~TRINITY_DN8789_c0_g3_i1.p1  ORF type:complete len:148 (+),score=40.18 TRINITY_DN8789_c0_g3_i1:58-501(+)